MCQIRVFHKWVRWKLWQISIKPLFLNIRVGIRVRGLHLVSSYHRGKNDSSQNGPLLDALDAANAEMQCWNISRLSWPTPGGCDFVVFLAQKFGHMPLAKTMKQYANGKSKFKKKNWPPENDGVPNCRLDTKDYTNFNKKKGIIPSFPPLFSSFQETISNLASTNHNHIIQSYQCFIFCIIKQSLNHIKTES